MAGLFKKAIGLFVEFDENQSNQESNNTTVDRAVNTISSNLTNSASVESPKSGISAVDTDKFAAYFEHLFEKSNLPGADYYEFVKIMETLETHIKDENARISATFASLSIQGLTKDILIETANKYKEIIQKDRADFNNAINQKSKDEVDQRQKQLDQFNATIAKNSEEIQRLTKEITDAQTQIGNLKVAITEEQVKLNKNREGYEFAYKAMLNKITTDVQKIQTIL